MERIALITGGTRGLGRALTLDLARRGFVVYATGRTRETLDALGRDADGLDVRPVLADVSDSGANAALAERIRVEHGGLDVLVHNASLLGPRVPLADYPADLFRHVLNVNVFGPFDLTQRVRPMLRPNAAVLFLTSGVGVVGKAGWGAYSVSKFAVEGLAQIQAEELRDAGVRVFTVDPGSMRTDMRAAAYPDEDPSRLRRPEDNTAPFLWALLEAGPEHSGSRLRAQAWTRPASAA